jgi:hypothetical protein
MRKLGVWALGVALLAALSMSVVLAADKKAADDDEDKPAAKESKGTWSWFTGWFSWKKKAPEKKPESVSDKTAAKAPAPVVDEAALASAREQAAYARRMRVCIELRQVAHDTNDTYLLSQAEQLEERIWAAYTRRTANPPRGRSVDDLDEEILDKHVGTGTAGRQPSATPADAAAPKGRNNSTAAREVKP